MSQIKQTEMRLSGIIQDGKNLIDEFKATYKKFESLLPDLPPSMKAERVEIQNLLLELAAQSRELKQEIKLANGVIAHIEGHYAWKKAVFSCFGDEGLAKCYEYFASLGDET